MILLFLLSTSLAQTLVRLDSLSPSRQTREVHLFPSQRGEVSYYSVPQTAPYSISLFHIPSEDVNQAIAEVSEEGLLVHSVCSYPHGNRTYYVVNAAKAEGTHEIVLHLSMTQLQELMRDRTQSRVEVSHICVNGDSFDVVWHHAKSFVAHFIVQEGSTTDILRDNSIKGQEGYYPHLIQPFMHNSTSQHSIAVWRKGFGHKFRVIVADDRSRQDLRSMRLQLRSMAPYDHRDYLSIWRDDGFTWRHTNIYSNSTLGLLEDTSMFDWEIEAEMRSQEVPAVSIAALKDGRLIFAKAYGYADILNETVVTPLHKFRLASVSKIMTAMAITTLINERRLSLNDRVFGPSGVLRNVWKGPSNIYLRSITIKHLLEHSSGAWSHFMKLEFSQRELTQHDYLQWILSNYQPTIIPGRVHIYSNIGYMFLGRVVEEVTGQSYEEYVRTAILRPLSIQGAAIAGRERMTEEVTYYSHDNASPYLSWDPHRMDSAAGWTLTPTQVSRVIQELGDKRTSTYAIMNVRGATRWNYGRGIQLGVEGSLYHVGSMAGSEAIAYTNRGVSVAILSNVRGTNENWLTPWMESLARRIVARFA